MTSAAPTFSQIKAQVAAVRRKIPQAGVIGIRATGRWTGESLKPDGDQAYWIRQCDSPLAMRLALREEADAGAIKVLVTSLEDKDLGDDILIRLAKRRLYNIDSWQIVRSLFQAHAVDPRLTRLGWLADKLLDLAPPEGYPLARGGFLDAETVWPLLLGRAIGLEGETHDLMSLLTWSLSADGVARFQRLEEHVRDAAIAWLSGRAGAAAEVVLRCAARLDRPDTLALGLAAGVVFHPATSGKLERSKGRFEERYFAGDRLDPIAIVRWSTVSTEVVRQLPADSRAKWQQLQRADEILGDVQAEEFAYLSDTSPLGFDQRLASFGSTLVAILQSQAAPSIDTLSEARQAIRDHEAAERETRRLERVEMSLRLVRWLAQQGAAALNKPQSLAQAAAEYLGEGGYVDWARLALRLGDPVRELSEAYARLFTDVSKFKEAQSQHFAVLLRDWTAAGSQGDDVIGVERILERIVAPIAAESAVLVIVIDGMSAAVYRELMTDVTRHDWAALAEPGRGFNRPGIATIPSVTEASRTSLLCGRLRQGSSTDEKPGFSEHAALVAHCRTGYPPMLFHKASLQEAEDTVLAAEVRREIASAHRKIVGVVVNAVDDHLLRGEQIDTRWSRDEIKVLPALLHEARAANRVVVLLSDHGHVLDCQSQLRAHEGGERWRFADGEPDSDELRISGSRVVIPESKALIAPWSEKIRYGVKKNGYHGGVSPQEMIVPIVVLARAESYPAGWHESQLETPLWWDESVKSPTLDKSPPKLKPAKPQPAGMLFDLQGDEEPVAATPAVVAPAVVESDWISRLLSSPVFEDQKHLGGRAIPNNDTFIQLLTAMDGRGGTMTSTALARTLNFPPLRLNGLLAVVQRVLNVDGYQVLSRDETSETVEFNRELLLKQFDLVEEMMMSISPQRRQEIIDALRRGTVPRSSLDAFSVGLDRFEAALDEELRKVSAGGSVFKAVRGEYGCGKTFFARWLADRARKLGFATSEVQVSETETPLHRLETVYRHLMERLSTADMPQGALKNIVDGWFFALEEDVLAEGVLSAGDQQKLLERTSKLVEQRLAKVSSTAPMFSAALRGYREAVAGGDKVTAEGVLAWLAGQPNVAAAAKRFAGVKGDIDHFGALSFLQGVLMVLRDSGHPGLLVILDEVETIQRVRSDVRDKSLNALRQLIDEVDSGRFPGLCLLITGTPAFFDGPQGVQRLEPLAQRLHVDFQTDNRFDNPRAVQIRLPAFNLERLRQVGCKVRDIFEQHAQAPQRVTAVCDNAYIEDLAAAVASRLGGKVGIAPRIFLKKLVADILDRIDQFQDFDPRQHYALTIGETELTPIERQAMGATDVDQIDLEM